MSNRTMLQLSFTELCLATDLSSELLIQFVDEGIIEPTGTNQKDWQFSNRTVTVVQKATRLHDDLDIGWPGIALAISLIEELDQLRSENQRLKSYCNDFRQQTTMITN